MVWNPIQSSEIQVKKPNKQSLWQKVKDDLDHLYSQLGSAAAGSGVPNGSFEIDSDADGVPDQWTKNLYPGGTGAIEMTDIAHGAKAYKFTHPGGSGNGGGYLDSDYIEVDELKKYSVAFMIKCSVAGMRNRVIVRCFDKAKADLSNDQTIYDSTSNPTSWTFKVGVVTIPANCRYVKIRIEGGYTDTDVAGDIYYDNIVFRRQTINEDIEDSAVSQPKLKTSSGEVSIMSASYVNLTLPGGEYGFYPQLKLEAGGGDSIDAIIASGFSGTSYTTIIALRTPNVSRTGYARQRYITSSGKDHWIFLLYDTAKKQIIAGWGAPDHPCYGQGGDETEIPHPFVDYFNKPLPGNLKIILLDNDLIDELKSKRTRNRGILEIINEEYEIGFTSSPIYQPREIIEYDEFQEKVRRREVKTLPAMIEYRTLKPKI